MQGERKVRKNNVIISLTLHKNEKKTLMVERLVHTEHRHKMLLVLCCWDLLIKTKNSRIITVNVKYHNVSEFHCISAYNQSMGYSDNTQW